MSECGCEVSGEGGSDLVATLIKQLADFCEKQRAEIEAAKSARGGGGSPPKCEVAPPGSSQICVLWYQSECAIMLAAYAACNGDEACELGVLAKYYERTKGGCPYA